MNVFLFLSIALSVSTYAIDFQKEIKPLFEAKCFKCHGEKKQKSGFRADNRWDLLKGGDSGEIGIIPGNAEKSFIVEAITTDDEDLMMPPKGERFSKAEVSLIKQWINEGAVWPGQMEERDKEEITLWSMQPLKRPKVPDVKTSTIKGDIDRFLQAAMNKNGLTPSLLANPEDLFRRASVILTGLRPGIAEVKAFLNDYEEDPEKAYEKLIDSLMASKHFGERWAQHWLDVIRWGETTGGEANLYRKNAWPYRDYVIEAFNKDLPYDQFIQEQIAGDLLGAPTATGFLVSGPNIPKNSIGDQILDHKIARADRLDQTIQTVSASMLGLTVGCARCHEHKFDPISLKDYYAMKAVFEDLEYEPRIPEYSKDHPKVIADKTLRSEIAKQRQKLSKFGSWYEDWQSYHEVHIPGQKTDKVRFEFSKKFVILDEIEIFDENGRNLLHFEDFELSAIEEGRTPNRPNRTLVDGAYGGWRSFQVRLNKNSTGSPWVEFKFKKPVNISKVRISINREFYDLSDFYMKRPFVLNNYTVKAAQNGKMKGVFDYFYFKNQLKKNAQLKSTVDLIHKKISDIRERGLKPLFIGKFLKKKEGLRKHGRSPEYLSAATGYLSELSFPGPTHILKRGDVSTPADAVEPAGLEAIDGKLNLTVKHANPERRLEYAKWLSSKKNPLTARVMVNRLWYHVFGRGLVNTGSDFGNAGAAPDHPELLDWLAHEFMNPQYSDNSWSMKHMIKLMVMSHAFQQSSLPNEDYHMVDADSIYLWRFNPRRVEAEVIRDNILKVTGNLKTQLGGRGYNIYGPKKLFGHWHMKDNYSEFTWRRLLYQDKMRRSDDEAFAVFDLPDCGQIRDKRSISTTPLQALNLLNSEFIISQSEFLEVKLKQHSSDLKEQINYCFQLLYHRAASEQEQKFCQEVAQSEGLAVMCRALFNTNEFTLLQ